MTEKMTYASVGVDYDALDPFKRMAQLAARDTAGNIRRCGFSEVEMSRGESVFLIETPDSYLAHVEEGLGTKILVADAMYRLTGRSYYDHIAQDTVAMIVNDMITLGALPLSVAMHLGVGRSHWFKDEARYRGLVDGWKRACNMACCAWGGGETQTLNGIIEPDAAVLSGSAIGIVKPKERLIAGNIEHGDAIILIQSSGIHANGLTMARKIAERLRHSYLTKLSDGRSYGETLLTPTRIYVPVIEDCLRRGVRIHYAVNITGHGWRKLMRAPQPFAYVIERLPAHQPIFDFIQQYGPADDVEAYGTFNMGAGFALYVPQEDARIVWEVLASYDPPHHLATAIAGHIEKSEKKEVAILPKGILYTASTLNIR